MHLPLTDIDASNQPSETYLWIQDGLTIGSGVLWMVAYVLYIRRSSKDQSYGMPILSLCANIAWELIYGIIHPPGMAEFITFLPYFLVDLLLVNATIKFGPREWRHAPIVQKNLGMIVLVGSLMMLGAQWTFAELFTDFTQASFWSGYTCQVIVSWSAIAQLVSRESTRGHSIAIWWCRFLGTLCATAVFHWRAYNYPANYGYVYTPLARFLFIAPETAELAYPFIFWYIAKLESRNSLHPKKQASEGSITATGPAALSSLESFISLDSVIFNPEPSALALLASAIPATVVSVITASPDAYLSFIENIGQGSDFPKWLTTLAADKQSAIESYYSIEREEIQQLASKASGLGIQNLGPLNSFAAQTPTTYPVITTSAAITTVATHHNATSWLGTRPVSEGPVPTMSGSLTPYTGSATLIQAQSSWLQISTCSVASIFMLWIM
ncbi:putative integral membrane protein [Botrytis cinerea BcDW1]|uniref:Putative integral membrane protein n=1 Tax=Botryotinia fuckeliana (strain BcDW1) TaxID=1290391 RepID=M7TX80_BOTF1|nr:putative integral membrane protein [Botrytis cinerea BcDW1]